MTKTKTIDPMLKEWCYAREVLRRMGFSADELFFAVASSGKILEQGEVIDLGKPAIAVEVKAQGLSFVWTIGGLDIPKDEIEDRYREACELWNAGDPQFNDDGFFASHSFGRHVELATALYAKGFRLASMGR
jgi:hypothetical protein